MKKDKIIIDVNIWISLIIMGKIQTLLDYILANSLEILSCNELLFEFANVVNRKKFLKYLQNTPQFYINLLSEFTNNKKIQLNFTGSPDPKDDHLFDLAQQSGAKYLVTGDKKLLEFKFPNLEIITMNKFFEKF